MMSGGLLVMLIVLIIFGLLCAIIRSQVSEMLFFSNLLITLDYSSSATAILMYIAVLCVKTSCTVKHEGLTGFGRPFR